MRLTVYPSFSKNVTHKIRPMCSFRVCMNISVTLNSHKSRQDWFLDWHGSVYPLPMHLITVYRNTELFVTSECWMKVGLLPCPAIRPYLLLSTCVCVEDALIAGNTMHNSSWNWMNKFKQIKQFVEFINYCKRPYTPIKWRTLEYLNLVSCRIKWLWCSCKCCNLLCTFLALWQQNFPRNAISPGALLFLLGPPPFSVSRNGLKRRMVRQTDFTRIREHGIRFRNARILPMCPNRNILLNWMQQKLKIQKLNSDEEFRWMRE